MAAQNIIFLGAEYERNNYLDALLPAIRFHTVDFIDTLWIILYSQMYLEISRTFTSLRELAERILSPIASSLWPLYSSGAVIGSICFLASVFEKSTLVNVLSSTNSSLQDQPEQDIKQAGELMESEAYAYVKKYVSGLSSDDFESLQRDRNHLSI